MKMKFAENLKIWSLISLAVIVIGLIIALTSGVNLGIDFTGGTMIHLNMHETYEVSRIQESIDEYDLDADVIHAGFEKTEIILKTKLSLDNTQRMEIFETLKNDFNLINEDFLEAEQFGPTVGKEIQSKALSSIIIASLGMLLYITLRFEIIYGVTAIIALIHDVLILLAVYSIFNIPINSS
ncbi:MAG: protein translocase subunit SecF, partial [Bacillota bacterium]|nr:protein translocase subunit SecF [Bacillota bacterium]